jgi:thymidylate synthase (FAD)
MDHGWLLSFNLRSALEAARSGDEAFRFAVQQVCPMVGHMMDGGRKPDRPARLEVQPREVPRSPSISVLQSLTPRTINSLLSDNGHPALSKEQLAHHCFFTFEAEGISRVATHQLVRHRPASYSQESQRFSAAVQEEFIIPETIQTNSEALLVATSALNSARAAYERLRELGIKKEDARFMLPLATGTRLMMTLTARYLRHITFLRSSSSPIGEKAQWEIRALADQMLAKARELMPEIDWTPQEAL